MTRPQQKASLGLLLAILAFTLAIVALTKPTTITIQQPDPFKAKTQPTVTLPVPSEIPDSPDDVPENGFFGYEPDRVAAEEFRRAYGIKSLKDESPELFNQGWGDDAVVLTKALETAVKETQGRQWVVGSQGIGDCVGWGWAHGISIELAVQYVTTGTSGDFLEVASEATYGVGRVEGRGKDGSGSRAVGGWGDGSYGAPTGKGVVQFGVLFRKPYPELGFDLTKYSSRTAKQWGAYGLGGEGDGGKAEIEAAKHRVGKIALIRTLEELDAALRNGYPAPVCCGLGFSSHRDANGFSRRQGSWAHCQVTTGVRYDIKGYLILNSWGPNWISGPKAHGQPEGSYWITPQAMQAMLNAGDTYAVSNTNGFPARKLDWLKGWGVIDREKPKVAAKPSRRDSSIVPMPDRLRDLDQERWIFYEWGDWGGCWYRIPAFPIAA